MSPFIPWWGKAHNSFASMSARIWVVHRREKQAHKSYPRTEWLVDKEDFLGQYHGGVEKSQSHSYCGQFGGDLEAWWWGTKGQGKNSLRKLAVLASFCLYWFTVSSSQRLVIPSQTLAISRFRKIANSWAMRLRLSKDAFGWPSRSNRAIDPQTHPEAPKTWIRPKKDK